MKKYIVRDGDTLASVSEVTGVKTNLLMAANPHITDADHLLAGQVLSIPELGKAVTATGRSAVPSAQQPPKPAPSITPVPSPPPPKHQVSIPTMPVESPSSPAYDTTISNDVTMGGSVPAGATSYFGFVWPHVVKPAETWQTICVTYGATMEQIQCLNPSIHRRPLYQGDVVYIPYLPKPVRRRQRQQQLMNQQSSQWGADAQYPQYPPTPGYLPPVYPYNMQPEPPMQPLQALPGQQPLPPMPREGLPPYYTPEQPYPYQPAPYQQQLSQIPYGAPYPPQPNPWPTSMPGWYFQQNSPETLYANWEDSSSFASDTEADWSTDSNSRIDTRPTGGTPDGTGTR